MGFILFFVIFFLKPLEVSFTTSRFLLDFSALDLSTKTLNWDVDMGVGVTLFYVYPFSVSNLLWEVTI